MTKLNENFWAGLLFVILGAALVFLLIPLGVEEPKRIDIAVLAPSYYPKLISIAMILIGASIALKALRETTAQDMPAAEADAPGAARAKLLIAVAILFATVVILPHAGFVLASTLALILLMILAGERRPMTIGLVAGLLPFGLYLFFTKLANIPIPGGVLDPVLLRL